MAIALNEKADPLAEFRAEADKAEATAATAEPAPSPEGEEAADEAEAAPSVEAQPETDADAGADPSGEEAPEEAKPEEEPKKKPKRDWATIKAGREEAKRKAAQEEARASRELSAQQAQLINELRAQIANGTEAAPEPGKPKTEAQIRAEVERELTARNVQQREVDAANARAERIAKAGGKNYGAKEFETAAGNLMALFDDDHARRLAFVDAADATDAPERVIYELAQDPEEAERIIALPPLKMAAEMARIIAKAIPKPGVSAAPRPPRQLGSNGTEPEGIYPKMSDAAMEKEMSKMWDRLDSKWNGKR